MPESTAIKAVSYTTPGGTIARSHEVVIVAVIDSRRDVESLFIDD